MVLPLKRKRKNQPIPWVRRVRYRAVVSKPVKDYVKRQIRKQDPKVYVNEATHSGTVGNLGFYTLGEDIRKGDNQGDRTGNSIFLKGVRFYFDLKQTLTTANNWPTVRFILCRDNQPHDSITNNFFESIDPTQNLPGAFLGTGDLNQIYKRLNTQRFQVIWDYSIKLFQVDAASMGMYQRNFYKYIPINKKLTYNDEVDAGNRDYLVPNYRFFYFIEKRDSSTGATTAVVKWRSQEFFND